MFFSFFITKKVPRLPFSSNIPQLVISLFSPIISPLSLFPPFPLLSLQSWDRCANKIIHLSEIARDAFNCWITLLWRQTFSLKKSPKRAETFFEDFYYGGNLAARGGINPGLCHGNLTEESVLGTGERGGSCITTGKYAF